MFTLFRVMSGAQSDAEAAALDSIMDDIPTFKFAPQPAELPFSRPSHLYLSIYLSVYLSLYLSISQSNLI